MSGLSTTPLACDVRRAKGGLRRRLSGASTGARASRALENARQPNERGPIHDRRPDGRYQWARRPCPVVSARAEVAAGADKPASILVGRVGREADRHGPLVTLGALQPIENSTRNLGQEPGVALDKRTAFRVRILFGHVILTWNSLSPGDFGLFARSQQY